MLTTYIEKLIERRDLARDEVEAAIAELITAAEPCQAASFLALLRAKGETVEELHSIVQAMRSRMMPVNARGPLLDIVGTGGDNAQTLNFSTAASIVAAASGAKVAKHGNRASSSRSGSADVLEALGINIQLKGGEVAACIEQLGIGFMYAPLFHPAMQSIRPMRRSLRIRTVFNVIGPLLNPAAAQHLLIGVSDRNWIVPMAEVLRSLKIGRAVVFHSCGLDEFSGLGIAEGLEICKDSITAFSLCPAALGISRCRLDDLRGGSASDNARRIAQILEGAGGAASDAVALNAAVGLWLHGVADSIQEGMAIAKATLSEGSAVALLQRWKDLSASFGRNNNDDLKDTPS